MGGLFGSKPKEQSYVDPGLKAQSDKLNQFAGNVQLGYAGDTAQGEDQQIRAGHGDQLGELATLDQNTAAQMKDVDRNYSLGERALGMGGGDGGAIALANSQEAAKGNIRDTAARTKGAAITGLHRELMDTYQGALNAQRGTQVQALGGGTAALSAGTNVYDANKRTGGILPALIQGGAQVGAAYLSDENAKTDIAEVNDETLLDRLVAMPIKEWRYKDEPEGVKHIGPMAQDFKGQFGLGDSDKKIYVSDASGVTMAGLQALARQIRDLKRKVA